MAKEDLTKEQLRNEVARLRNRLAEFEAAEGPRLPRPDASTAGFLQRVVECLPHNLLVIDAKDRTVVLANRIARKSSTRIGQHCFEVSHDRKSPCQASDGVCPMEKVLETGEPAVIEHKHIGSDGSPFLVEIHAAPLFDADGHLEQLVTYSFDITDRKRGEQALKDSLREKELLLREVHHRVKNNMQVISSLLRHTREEGAIPLEVLERSQDRINCMSLIHEQLYRAKDLSNVDFGSYVRTLVARLFSSHGVRSDRIHLSISAEDVTLAIDTAIPVGLIVNELVTNCLQHAFPADASGEIAIELRSIDQDTFEIVVADDGVGMDPAIDYRNVTTLGLELVTNLAEYQLGGTIDLDTDHGTRFRITSRRSVYRDRLLDRDSAPRPSREETPA